MTQAKALQCTRCQAPMEGWKLEGHYGNSVAVEACLNCHWVWFDPIESVRLSGLGWVQLLREMMGSPRALPQAPQSVGTTPPCAQCTTPTKAVRNLSRFGRTAAFECAAGHGQFQGFSMLLAERGLVRPVASIDLKALTEEGRALSCMNCGADAPEDVAAVGASFADKRICAHCDSPFVMFDVPRLTQALLARHGQALEVAEPAQQLGLECTGCGHPLDPTRDLRCEHCDHSVALPSLAAIKPMLDAVEPILKGKLPRQAKPWGSRWEAERGDPKRTQLARWMRHASDPSDWRNQSTGQRVINIVIVAVLLFVLLRSCG